MYIFVYFQFSKKVLNLDWSQKRELEKGVTAPLGRLNSLIASAIPCCCLCFVSIFPCLCPNRFFGFVSVYRLISRPPSPLQRRKQRHSYHKYINNFLTEQHNSHLNKVHLKLQRNWRSAWTRSRNDKRFISKIKPTWTRSRCSNWWQPTKCRRTSWLNSWWLPRYLPGKMFFSSIFSIFFFSSSGCPVPMYLPGIWLWRFVWLKMEMNWCGSLRFDKKCHKDQIFLTTNVWIYAGSNEMNLLFSSSPICLFESLSWRKRNFATDSGSSVTKAASSRYFRPRLGSKLNCFTPYNSFLGKLHWQKWSTMTTAKCES